MLMLLLLLPMILLLSAIFLPMPSLLSLLLLHPQCCWRALPVADVPSAAGVPAVAGVLSVASILTIAESPCFCLSVLHPCCCRHSWCSIRLCCCEGIPGVAFAPYVADTHTPGVFMHPCFCWCNWCFGVFALVDFPAVASVHAFVGAPLLLMSVQLCFKIK